MEMKAHAFTIGRSFHHKIPFNNMLISGIKKQEEFEIFSTLYYITQQGSLVKAKYLSIIPNSTP